MTRQERAKAFAALHRKGDPVILYNIWDAGSAQAVLKAGAKALATGSFSVAAAQGYGDGEAIALDLALGILRRIVAVAGDTPVTLDFEGAYAVEPSGVGTNVAHVIEAGAIGMNFEDQVVGGKGLHEVAVQASRIAAARKAADAAGIDFFINARTDIFLKADPATHSSAHVAQALERAKAYADAGASGFFVPGLVTPDLIGQVTSGTALPVNIMMKPGAPRPAELAGLAVARISHGPFPYREAMQRLEAAAQAAFAQS